MPAQRADLLHTEHREREQHDRHRDLTRDEHSTTAPAHTTGRLRISAQRLANGHTCEVERRSESAHDKRQDRRGRGCQKHLSVQLRIEADRRTGKEMERGSERHHERARQDNPETAAEHTDDDTLDDLLADQPRTGCAKGHTDGEFLSAQRAASQCEVREIGARDEQHEANERNERGRDGREQSLDIGLVPQRTEAAGAPRIASRVGDPGNGTLSVQPDRAGWPVA